MAERGRTPDESRASLEPHCRVDRAAQPGLRREVVFRGSLHDGPHEHLVDEKLFSRVQALLAERGEDYSKRASATSEFLLAGLVVCTKCGKRYVGTSAVGNRYRYYTCFSRQRYGTKYCDAERLPADELDSAVLDATLHTYERTDLFDKAVTAARRRAKAQQANHAQELAFVDAEAAKAEDAIERYLGAFEAGTLSESQCGTRLQKLGAKVADLRARREELLAAIEQASAAAPSADELSALRDQIAHALANGSVPARKSLLQSLVHEIRVDSRDRVVPWFRVPGGADPKVRALGGWAPPAGLEPAHPAPEAGALSAELRGRKRSAGSPTACHCTGRHRAARGAAEACPAQPVWWMPWSALSGAGTASLCPTRAPWRCGCCPIRPGSPLRAG